MLRIWLDEIFKNLQRLNIKNEYYCYKWFILLFSQEFENLENGRSYAIIIKFFLLIISYFFIKSKENKNV